MRRYDRQLAADGRDRDGASPKIMDAGWARGGRKILCGENELRRSPAAATVSADYVVEGSVTDFSPQLFELRCALLQAPFIDRFNIEAPVTANLEAR